MNINNPLDLFMGYQLRRASIAMTIDLRTRLKPFGITPSLSCVLMLIDSNDNITQSTISKKLSIKRANMVSAINTLENIGYVRREAIDGRSQKLILTEKGKEAIDSIYTLTHESEEKFKDMLGADISETVISTLPKVWEEIE